MDGKEAKLLSPWTCDKGGHASWRRLLPDAARGVRSPPRVRAPCRGCVSGGENTSGGLTLNEWETLTSL